MLVVQVAPPVVPEVAVVVVTVQMFQEPELQVKDLPVVHHQQVGIHLGAEVARVLLVRLLQLVILVVTVVQVVLRLSQVHL